MAEPTAQDLAQLIQEQAKEITNLRLQLVILKRLLAEAGAE